MFRSYQLAQPCLLHAVLLFTYGSALASLILHPGTKLGYAGMAVAIAASFASTCAAPAGEGTSDILSGAGFFTVNLLSAALLLIPPERFSPHRPLEAVMSTARREALFYCLATSMLVQALAFLAPAPAMEVPTWWAGIRAAVSGQPLLVQVSEIIVLTDLAQFWLHRAIASLPFSWRFHAASHCARAIDWLSGSELHQPKPLAARYLAAVPMLALGFSPLAVQACLAFLCVGPAMLEAYTRWFASRRRRQWHQLRIFQSNSGPRKVRPSR